MNSNKERRFFADAAKVDEESKEMIVEGYAVKFEQPATHEWTEVIDRHAFDNCDMTDVCLQYNHSEHYPIMARTRNNTLQLEVDDIGLKIRATLIDTQANRDIYTQVQHKGLDKMSFAFTVVGEEWDYETNTRRITAIDKLYDVAIVDVPFYPSTEVFARSADSYKEEKEKYQALKLAKAKAKAKLSLN